MGLLVTMIFTSIFMFPHGDLHQRIEEISERLIQSPDSIELYMVRGELLLLHGDQEDAKKDFYTCLHHRYLNDRVYLGLSKAIFSEALADSSLLFVELALILNPSHPSCLEWKAFVLQTLQQPCLAADTYEYLLGISPHASPALYIDAANAWSQCPLPDAEEKAIATLLSGISSLGQLHVLEKHLVRLYLEFGRMQEALDLQSEIITHWNLKATPYLNRAKIYLSMGNISAAEYDLHAALAALDQLPYYKMNTTAMKNIRSTIQLLLDETTN